MNRLFNEIWLCMAVSALLLIGGAVVLVVIQAEEGLAVIASNARGGRRGFLAPQRTPRLSLRRMLSPF